MHMDLYNSQHGRHTTMEHVFHVARCVLDVSKHKLEGVAVHVETTVSVPVQNRAERLHHVHTGIVKSAAAGGAAG